MLKSTLRKMRGLYHRMTATRAAGLRSEISFWERWFESRGLQWPDEYQQRLDPLRSFPATLTPYLADLPPGIVRVLDVGAGPLTCLGTYHERWTLQITATDVLAPQYDRILRRYGVTPPIRTIYADAERLSDVFSLASFDLVHAQNSIDHTQSPLAAIRQMLVVVKPGRYVILGHEENEAENEGYAGLHQWNFTLHGADFVIRGHRQTLNVTQLLASEAEVTASASNGWLTVQLRRRPSPGRA